jgi:hypothetical protein
LYEDENCLGHPKRYLAGELTERQVLDDGEVMESGRANNAGAKARGIFS